MVPGDENPIANETPLYRRINPDAPHVIWDDNRGCMRVTTGAFRDPEMSVALGDRLDELGREPLTVLDDYPGQFLVLFAAGAARAQEQTVVRDPSAEEPAHGLVLGKKPKPVMKALAAASIWVAQPEGACPRPDGSDDDSEGTPEFSVRSPA